MIYDNVNGYEVPVCSACGVILTESEIESDAGHYLGICINCSSEEIK